MMSKGVIYKYTFPNGKIYIGQTVDLDKRHKQHLYYAKHAKGKRALCDIAIAKYGEPKLEVIEEVVEDSPSKFKKMLNESEVKWINEYNATDRNIGYNIQQGGHTSNEETYILEEIYNEKIQEQAEKIFYVREILDSIIEKVGGGQTNDSNDDEFIVISSLNLKKYNLTKEEKEVWFEHKFRDYEGDIITFDFFVKHLPILDDFASVVNYAFEVFLIDISKSTWSEIEGNKENLIENFFNTEYNE